ncbi:hypothetical protein, partial [Agrobacterium sp. 22-226-1]
GQPIDQSLIRQPYLEVAHFSVEKPAQFRVETNTNLYTVDGIHDDREISKPTAPERNRTAVHLVHLPSSNLFLQ